MQKLIDVLKSYKTNILFKREDSLSLSLYLWMIATAATFIFLYGSYRIYTKHYLLATVDYAIVGINLIFLYFVYKKRYINTIFRITTFLFFVFFTYIVFITQGEISRVVWVFCFPIAMIFVTGLKEGLIWSIILLIVISLELYLFFVDTHSMLFIVTVIATYIVITLLVSTVEFFKNSYYYKLQEQHKLLQQEIDKKMKLEHKLIRLSREDSLTNILNQRFFWESVDREIDISKRYKTKLCLAIIDVDYFKHINDSYGHPKGDLILQEITKELKNAIRKNDLIGRIGGDEFAILFLNIQCEEAYKKLEALRESINSLELKDLNNHKISISVGLANFNENLSSSEKLYKNADTALYKAKESGRNRVILFDSSQSDK